MKVWKKNVKRNKILREAVSISANGISISKALRDNHFSTGNFIIGYEESPKDPKQLISITINSVTPSQRDWFMDAYSANKNGFLGCKTFLKYFNIPKGTYPIHSKENNSVTILLNDNKGGD